MLHQHYISLLKNPTSFVRNNGTLRISVKQWALLYNKCFQNLSPHTHLLRHWQASHRFSCVLTVAFCRSSICCLHAPNWEVSFEFGGEKSSVWNVSIFDRLNKLKNECLSELTFLHWTRLEEVQNTNSFKQKSA